ncbi:MAG TPA: hypothetical protein VHL56_04305 [Candidatus Limnocylindrales bacterium]|jgi:hypothetical protein|nr:hypothetical protein [Candidatus Limnocylindrales bacterium]
MNRNRLATRLAGAGYALLGAGFGIGALWATLHLRRTGELPMTPWGFRALSGPFERLGTDAFSALGIGLVVMSVLNVVAGALLWRGDRRGLRLSLATFVPTMGLGAGFALPFLLIGLPISVALAVAGRRTQRPT